MPPFSTTRRVKKKRFSSPPFAAGLLPSLPVTLRIWWWDFRLVDVLKHWTLWNYFLIICYAGVLFLLVALLIPNDWDKVDDLNAYLLSKRRWFYSVFLLGLIIDVMDSYIKGGWTYIIGLGVLGSGYSIAGIPVAIIGFRSTRIRTHTIMGIVFCVWELVLAFDLAPWLHR